MISSTQVRRVGIPRRRWLMGCLLGTGVLVNYIDRINLSVAAPQLKEAFGFTSVELGVLFSAYAWSYALFQIPTGLFLDKFGVTLAGRIGSFLWIIASLATGLATGMTGLFAARILLGIAEAPTFPANAKATGYWFPRTERALATSIFDAAAKFSNVIGVPLVAVIVVHFGWRAGFMMTAGLSFLYFLAYYLIYRDPSQDRKLDPKELAYIRDGDSVPEGAPDVDSASLLKYLLSNRKVWGLTIGFSAYGYTFYLFLTWLPGYLVETMHMDIIKSSFFTIIPWLFATATDLLIGGVLVDRLISKGYDENKVRKTVLVAGMLMGLAVFGATQTTDPYWAIVWITIALSGLAFAAPVGWSIPGLIAPKGGAGTIGGIMNFVNNLMAIAAPIVTGYIVGLTHSFTAAFYIAGVVLIIGIISFTVVLGRLDPIPSPSPAR